VTGLVVISLEAWDDVWRRNQHLVAGLVRSDPTLRVLFVEPAADPLHAATTGGRPRRGHGLRRAPAVPGIEPGQLWLYQPTKWLPRRIDGRLDRRWAAAVRRAAHRIELRAPRLWVNSPSGAHVLLRTGWPALYDITDDWLAAHRSSAQHQRMAREEAYLLDHCAEVVVCSPSLQRLKQARRVTLIPNAVDVELYRTPNSRPDDLPSGPYAVYVGTLHADRLDIDLCEATARALGADGRLVLVGPELLSAHDRARLQTAGAVLLGPRRHTTIPGYLQHAEVLVVPHLVNAFTESLDPIKAYEYAAVGRPVVTTPVAGFRELDEDRITVVEGVHFAAAVRRGVLAGPSPVTGSPRLEAVPGWSDRVEQMRTVLERLPSR
jgi:glycosyltransferase involved in cell wall biosynthesis